MRFNRYTRLMAGEGEVGGGGGAAGGDAAAQAAAAAAVSSQQAEPRFGFIKDDFSFEPGWQDKLPDDNFKDFKATAANYKSLPELLKGLKEAKTAAMAKVDGMVKLPTTPEEWAAFKQERLDVPKDETGYEVTPPDDKELAAYFKEDQVKAFLKEAHKMGISKAQAKELVTWQLTQTRAADMSLMDQGRQLIESRDKKLKETWGTNYESNMVDVARVGQLLGINPDSLKLAPPEVTLGLMRVSQLISEDKLPARQQVVNNMSKTTWAREVQTNPKHPDYADYHDRSSPRWKELVQRVNAANQEG